MKPIRYLKGDATSPQAPGPKIIAHVCNDIGRWGKGFVLALSQRSPEPERAFRQWFAQRQANDFGLGAVQFVQIEPGTWVANMIGQHKVRVKGDGGEPPVRYEAIEQCLEKLAARALEEGASVHMPRLGCGLAGGRIEKIIPLVERALASHDVQVFLYSRPDDEPELPLDLLHEPS